MNRKWTLFGLFAGVFATLALASMSTAQDKKHSDLEEIMEKVQKHKGVITKGTRNPALFKKEQKNVEKSAKELAKLAKEAKPIKDYLKNAKDEKNPQAKWDEICDQFHKSADDLAKLVAKDDVGQPEAKKAFAAVNKSCADCHSTFKVEE